MYLDISYEICLEKNGHIFNITCSIRLIISEIPMMNHSRRYQNGIGKLWQPQTDLNFAAFFLIFAMLTILLATGGYYLLNVHYNGLQYNNSLSFASEF